MTADPKEGLKQALASFNDVTALSKQNIEALVASATAAAKGAEALSAETMAFAKTAMEQQAQAAAQLGGVKSAQEAVELQTAYAKRAMESYVAEVAKLSEIVAASVTEAIKPLSDRVTAVTAFASQSAARAGVGGKAPGTMDPHVFENG